MNKYECLWRTKRITVEAPTTYEAQQKAQSLLKVKKAYEITVLLVELGGEEYVHCGSSL
jgi:hypothetical protein